MVTQDTALANRARRIVTMEDGMVVGDRPIGPTQQADGGRLQRRTLVPSPSTLGEG